MGAFQPKHLWHLPALALLCALTALAWLSAPPAAAARSIDPAPRWEQASAPPPAPPAYPSPASWRQRELCELSNHAQALLNRTPARIGAAVVDLRSGELWVGGDRQPFALHSVVKAPIAWLTLATAEQRGEPLSRGLAERLRWMIAWSDNEGVERLLDYLGGLPALRDYYAELGLDAMAANLHQFSWGRGRGSAADVAATFAALATSEDVSPSVRTKAFALLAGVIPEQRWGAAAPPRELHGWSALVKTGLFPEPQEGLRVNSAAIWLDSARRPRYVVAIMSAEHRLWGPAFERQNAIGAAIGRAVLAREQSAADPNAVCSPLVADRRSSTAPPD